MFRVENRTHSVQALEGFCRRAAILRTAKNKTGKKAKKSSQGTKYM